MDDYTLGLNWYMENNLKMMFNYIHYETEDYGDYTKYKDLDDDIFQTRLQWFF